MFTELSTLLNDKETLCINIMKTGDHLVVVVLPQSADVKDPAKENLIPLSLKGSPEELDENFIKVISEPVLKATGIITNMGEYEKAAEKAEQESKAVKDKQEFVTKKLKEVETLEKEKKFSAAIAVCRSILDQDKNNVKARLKIGYLQQKTGNIDLFAPVGEVTPVEELEENDTDNDFENDPDE
jgi:PRTRC genetic system protein E